MSTRDKITLATLRSMKLDRRPISMLTAYDYPMAQIEEAAGIECILVGDSAAQVILGHNSTLPITVDFLVTLAAAVRRGAPTAYLVGDMPYMSYHVNHEEAIRNAGRFMAEAGCDCVKVEGDGRIAPTIEKMTAATIPVMAHLGLRPQAVHQIGGYRAQGRDAAAAERLVRDAKLLEAAGACAIVLEAVPAEPARQIAESTDLPVIGCGAGPFCDGHVLVLHDMMGLADGPPPKFVKQYADIRGAIRTAVDAYIEDIRSRKYPAAEHTYKMRAGEASVLADRAAGI
ncbi:MAG: 3-methyl-2-oxobutanoate hydroxymethyltransferase [Phycisphaerales bacterium]|nr:3-methyl-2-oxobutanoate hydroxymethyltransferase [Phycisphaerales bacterium]